MIFALVRKLGKAVRGGAGPQQVFLGFLLGVFVGMVPGVNLTLLLAIVALLVINAYVGMFMLGLVLGKILCLILAPVTFRLGYIIIHNIGLEGLFASLANAPVLALLNLHVYSLVGGMPIAIAVGAFGGFLAAKIVLLLRAGLVGAESRNSWLIRVADYKIAALILRYLFGKKKASIAEMAEQKHPTFRKSGVVLVAIFVVVFIAAEMLLLNMIGRKAAVAGLEAAFGAEVNIGSASFSLLGGKIEMENVQITDPEKPTHNLLQAKKIDGSMGIGDLLARRVVIDRLEISGARTDVQRQTPGKVYEKAAEPERDEPEQPEDALAKYVEPSKRLQKYKPYFEKVYDYLVERHEARRAEEGKTPEERERERRELEELARQQGYLKMSAAGLLAKHPALTIRELFIDEILIGEYNYNVRGEQISTAPELNLEPMTASLKESDGRMDIGLAFNFATGKAHTLALSIPSMPASGVLSLSDGAPLDVSQAELNIRTSAEFSHEQVNMPLNISVKNLQAQPREGKTMLDLDERTAAEIMRNLDELTFTATVIGPIRAPSLKLDEQQILASIKESFKKAGKDRLAGIVDQQLQTIREKAREEVIEQVGEGIERAKEDLLPDDINDKADEIKDEIKDVLPDVPDIPLRLR